MRGRKPTGDEHPTPWYVSGLLVWGCDARMCRTNRPSPLVSRNPVMSSAVIRGMMYGLGGETGVHRSAQPTRDLRFPARDYCIYSLHTPRLVCLTGQRNTIHVASHQSNIALPKSNRGRYSHTPWLPSATHFKHHTPLHHHTYGDKI